MINISLNELVYDLIELYRANYKNTDSLDELQVRNWIHSARAAIIKSRLDQNPFYIDESWVQKITAQVEEVTHNGTTYMKTIEKIPATINRRGGEGTFTRISSHTIGSAPYEIVSYDRAQYAGNGVFNRTTKYAFPNDGYIYVKNMDLPIIDFLETDDGDIPIIVIKGVFMNPELVAQLDGIVDFENSYDYPIDQSIIPIMQDMIKKSNFNFVIQQIEDKKADGADSVTKDN